MGCGRIQGKGCRAGGLGLGAKVVELGVGGWGFRVQGKVVGLGVGSLAPFCWGLGV